MIYGECDLIDEFDRHIELREGLARYIEEMNEILRDYSKGLSETDRLKAYVFDMACRNGILRRAITVLYGQRGCHVVYSPEDECYVII